MRSVRACCVASPAFAQQTHLLVITGVPGDEEHAQKFQKWAATFIEAAKKKDAVPDANITLLADKQATKAEHREGVRRSRREGEAGRRGDRAADRPRQLQRHARRRSITSAPTSRSTTGAKLLGKLPSQRVAFVDTTSSSGAFLPAIGAPGRVVVTATKTGGERNETQFPEFFVAAYDDPAADRDRNGHVSVAEAFEYAKAKVVQAFQQKGLLLTEHAVMDEGGGGGLAATAVSRHRPRRGRARGGPVRIRR